MLKLDGTHKVTNWGVTKNKKPYINIFLTKLENSTQKGKQIEVKEQWISARVFFNQTNIIIDDLTKHHRAELCGYRFMGLDKWTSDKQEENVENYTFKIYADYVRFVLFKDKEDNQDKPQNDKIEVSQQPKQKEDDSIVWSDKALEEDIDWDAEFD